MSASSNIQKECQKDKNHLRIHSLLVSMAIFTVSITLKVYSRTSWYTLTYVIPPKANTADRAESGNERQFLIHVFEHHRQCTKKKHFRLHRQQILFRFEIISTLTVVVRHKQRKCHFKLTSSGDCMCARALRSSQGLQSTFNFQNLNAKSKA